MGKAKRARQHSNVGKDDIVAYPTSLIAEPDEFPVHLAAKIAGVVLAVGFDDDANRAVERTEADERRKAVPLDADHANTQLCRNPAHALLNAPRWWGVPVMFSHDSGGSGKPRTR